MCTVQYGLRGNYCALSGGGLDRSRGGEAMGILDLVHSAEMGGGFCVAGAAGWMCRSSVGGLGFW